jgi:hypothetical protein
MAVCTLMHRIDTCGFENIGKYFHIIGVVVYNQDLARRHSCMFTGGRTRIRLCKAKNRPITMNQTPEQGVV